MSRRSPTNARWTGRALALCVLAVTAGGSFPARAAAEDPQAPPPQAGRRHAPRQQVRGLEARVALLTKVLDLDARQQLEVKQVLEGQRAQVLAVWSDPSVPAARRIAATQAISDRTIERIRALLSEDQKKKYRAAPRAHEPPGSRPSVEAWMSKPKPT